MAWGSQIFDDLYVIYIKYIYIYHNFFFLFFFPKQLFFFFFFSLSVSFSLHVYDSLNVLWVCFFFNSFLFFSSQFSFQLFCKSSVSRAKWKYLIVSCSQHQTTCNFFFFFNFFLYHEPIVKLSLLHLFVWWVKHGSHVSYCNDFEENQIFYLMGIWPFFLNCD